MDPIQTTGIVAAVYAIARSLEEGVKKIVNALDRNRKDARQHQEDAQQAAQFELIQRELKQILIQMTKMGTRSDDLVRRIEDLEKKFDKYVTNKIERTQ